MDEEQCYRFRGTCANGHVIILPMVMRRWDARSETLKGECAACREPIELSYEEGSGAR